MKNKSLCTIMIALLLICAVSLSAAILCTGVLKDVNAAGGESATVLADGTSATMSFENGVYSNTRRRGEFLTTGIPVGADGGVLKIGINEWSRGWFKINFTNSVNIDDIDSLTFKTYFHIGPKNDDTVINVNNFAYGLFRMDATQSDLSVNYTGVSNAANGVLLNNIKYSQQDAWVDIVIGATDLAKLADTDGNISGFMFWGETVSDSPTNNLIYAGWNPYMLIDSITYKEKEVVSANNSILTDGTATTAKLTDSANPYNRVQQTFLTTDIPAGVDGGVIKASMAEWAIGWSKLEFTNPVSAENLDGLTFRMYFDIGALTDDSVITNSTFTYALYPLSSDEATVLVPIRSDYSKMFAPDAPGVVMDNIKNSEQRQWLDINVDAAGIEKLKDSEGKISGFYLVTSTNSTGGKKYSGWASYMLIDSISCVSRYTATAAYESDNLNITVQGARDGFLFQYWIKKTVVTDNNSSNLGAKGTIWTLASAYTENNTFSVALYGVDDDIAAPSPYLINDAYEIMVRVKAESTGEVVRDIYLDVTPESLGAAHINGVIVNSSESDGVYFVERSERTAQIEVQSNTAGAEYTFTAGTFTETNATGIFEVPLTALPDGYTEAEIIVSNDDSEDSLNITFYTYGEYVANEIAVITNFDGESVNTVAEAQASGKSIGDTTYTLTLKYADGTNIATADLDNFEVKLYSQGVRLMNPIVETNGEGELTLKYSVNHGKTGVYYVNGTVARVGNAKADDKIIEYYYGNARRANFDYVTTNGEYSFAIGESIAISAENAEITNFDDTSYMGGIQYAFYREDASGWVLIQNYSVNNTLNWQPSKAGKYNISVRIKADDGISYECSKNREFTIGTNALDVADLTFVIKDVSGAEIAVSGEGADAYYAATAGTPYFISANYAGTEDVLYMFIMTNANEKTVYLNKFGPNESLMFIPYKAENYEITIRVVEISSYGYRDISTVPITIKSTI